MSRLRTLASIVNSALRRRCSAYRRRQNLYAKNTEGLQRAVIPKHKEEATDDIREKGERG